MAWDFLKDNIPLLDCPDENIQRTYYFRWWTYRKHIKKTPVGFIVDEFLPNVGWAGPFNSISCAAGHHVYEGRWLCDPRYLFALAYASEKLARVTGPLPSPAPLETSGGWKKFARNPVTGVVPPQR